MYCCESPEGAEDSLRLCSASIETRWCVGAGLEKPYKMNSYVIVAISMIYASVCEMSGKCCKGFARRSQSEGFYSHCLHAKPWFDVFSGHLCGI